MTSRLRKAQARDLAAIVAIKEALRLDPGQRPERGGFLLGCSPERYALLIQCANVLLLEEAGEVKGFAVTLPDPVLKASELWARRQAIRWRTRQGEPPAGEPIGYFDQLALRPDARRMHAPALALAAARALAEAGHVHLYATILDAPVRNEASLPLLRALGARPVGTMEEHYEGVGRVVSELFHVRLGSGIAALTATPIGARTAAAGVRLAA
jgi:hypothetical protein